MIDPQLAEDIASHAEISGFQTSGLQNSQLQTTDLNVAETAYLFLLAAMNAWFSETMLQIVHAFAALFCCVGNGDSPACGKMAPRAVQEP